MKYILKILSFSIGLLFLSSCAIQQDYYFEKNGEVKMDLEVDMSMLFSQLPSNEMGGLNSIQDSINANTDIQDSLEEHGVKEFKMEFDTTTHKLVTKVVFEDMKAFTHFMNEDRDKKLKPIDVNFNSSKFTVKNSGALMSNEMLDGLKGSSKGNEGMDMDMSKFFTFKTAYHFPYEIDTYTYQGGESMLSEDKKSISFNNLFEDFTNEDYRGDMEVKFK